MHEMGAPETKKDPPVEPSGRVKEGKHMSNGHAPSAIGMKSVSFRQCKSFNLKESMLPKAPTSHENNKTLKSNGAVLIKGEALSSVENGRKISLSNGATKSSVNPPLAAKPKQSPGSKGEAPSNGTALSKGETLSRVENGGKISPSNGVMKSSIDPPLAASKPKQSPGPKADVQPSSRSEKVKSPGILKNSSSAKVNVDTQKRNIKEASPKKPSSFQGDKGTASSKVNKIKDTSPMSSFPPVRSLSLSLNADPQKKLPPIKTARVGGGAKTGASTKNTANLCAECKAELEGAVCFIGNDGRVSACTSRMAVRLCKNLKCANNNPEYVASLAAAITAPKKYLVSRRHSLTVPRSSLPSIKSSKAMSDKTHAQSPNQNGTVSPHGESDDMPDHDGDHECEEFDMQGELEDDVTSLEDIGEVVEIDGVASASPQRGRLNGYHRMRRRSFSVIERQGPEVVTLKKQMTQERKQAEEWMLDYAIEEALHKLAPASESKVKALVVAFESIIPHKDTDAVAAVAAQDQPEGLNTPNKISVKI